MSFYSDQATQFQNTADTIQTRITNAGSTMDDATRSALEDQRDGLENQVNVLVQEDVQATLAQLNLDQPRLAACTASLNKAMQTIKTLNQIVAIGKAALSLATAIASADPGAIVSALAGAETAVAAVLAKPSVTAMPSPAAAPTQGSATGTITTLAASGDPQQQQG